MHCASSNDYSLSDEQKVEIFFDYSYSENFIQELEPQPGLHAISELLS